MTVVLIIFLGLLALIALFLLLPARVRVRHDKVLEVWVGAGPLTLRVLPLKPPRKDPQRSKKTKKPRIFKTRRKPKTKPPKAPKPSPALENLKPVLTLDTLLAYARLVRDMLGSMLGTVRIRRLRLHAVVAAEDPGKAALAYGGAAAALGGLVPAFEKIINWRQTDMLIEVGFEGKARATIDIVVSIMPIVVLIAALRAFSRYTKINQAARKKQAAQSPAPQGASPAGPE